MTVSRLLAIAVLGGLCCPARSNPTLFDSFNTGGLNLAYNGAQFDFDMVQFLVDRRRVTGSGNPEWSASLDSSAGILHYEVEPRVPPDELTHLLLDYRNANGSLFSIADFEAFALDLPEVAGSGYLRVTVNDFITTNSLPELITQPGTLYYPFSNMTLQPIGFPIRSVQFYFFPLNGDFSVGVDQITVIPEPAGTLLLVSAIIMFGARRTRLS